jgi:PEP-CTERM motif
MKKLILTAVAMTCAVSVFAQGTVTFNNRVTGSIITHIYAPLADTGPLAAVHQVGNGANDTASSTTDWTGYSLIGVGLTGKYAASTTFAQLLGAAGLNAPETSLLPASPTTTFRSGAAAGFIAGTTTAFANIGPDSPGTVQMVAWDNSTGLYSTWTQASSAWLAGTIAAGMSNPLNLTVGGTGTPPYLMGLQSFNLYFVPEPSTFALAGLGAAALLIFRRRK